MKMKTVHWSVVKMLILMGVLFLEQRVVSALRNLSSIVVACTMCHVRVCERAKTDCDVTLRVTDNFTT